MTRKAVEFALVGDPTAMRLCVERMLPPCRDRMVKFALAPIENPADIASAMRLRAALAARRGRPPHHPGAEAGLYGAGPGLHYKP